MKKETKYFIGLLLLFIFIVSCVHILRFKNSLPLPLYEQYNHISSIQKIKAQGYTIGENYLLDYFLSNFEDYLLLFRILPLVFGIINIILIYEILKFLVKKYDQRIYTLLIFVLSPSITFIYSTHNEIYLPMFFILLGTLFLIKQKHLYSLIFFICSIIFNQYMIYVVILIQLLSYEKQNSKNSVMPIISLILVSYGFILINNLWIEGSNFVFLKEMISDFGAVRGTGTFSLILLIIGISISWKDKKKYNFYYLVLISLLISSFYNRDLLLFLDLGVIYFAGFALYTIVRIKWSSETLKNYVIILIICGLIFSSGAYIKKLSEVGPSENEINSLLFLNNNNKGGKVLSDYEYGFLINSYSGLDAYIDTNYYLHSKDKLRINMTKTVFMSRDLNYITQFLDREKIRYIWINSEMKAGKTWKTTDEGIQLVLKNSVYFKKIYDENDIEIWSYFT